MHGAPRYAADFASQDYADLAAPKGGELRLAKNGSFNNLNKNVILGNTPDEWLEHVNDPLMQRAWNEPFTLYGLVAESVDVADDRSWVIFHLNKNARFHDGVPMTAEDVKFSYESLRKYGHPVRRRVYGLVSKVEILNEHDIKFTFGPGYDRESVMILALLPVLPKHYWEKHDISKTTLEPPLGSGPYKITAVDPGRRIVYERVKDYWGRDLPVNRGFYNFDKVVQSFYRDDSIALESFKGGDYDLRREYDIKKWNTGYDFPAVRQGKVKKEEVAHHHPEWLKGLIFNTRRPLFRDRRVREALSLMFDYGWMNRTLYFGGYNVIDSTFMNSELAAHGQPEGVELAALAEHKNDLPPDVFGDMRHPPADDTRANKRRAIALLKEAGWVYRDEKLVRSCSLSPRTSRVGEGRGEGGGEASTESPTLALAAPPPHPDPLPPRSAGEREKCGEEFAFEILLGDPGDEKLALEFSRMLKTVGISARVRTVDNAQFTGRLQDFDYDMVSFKWLNSLSPGNEQLNYWGSAAADNKGSRNYPGIKNPAIDALASGIAAAPDRETLVARAQALDRALMWGYYFVPMFYSGRDRVAYGADLQRPGVTPVYGIILESWWKTP